MARVQVYVPDELHEQLKARGLRASELFQAAVRAELRRLDLERETDQYLAELMDDVGEPTAADMAHADAVVKEIIGRRAPSVRAS